MIKPKKAVCGVKSGKSRPVSKNNKSWFQRIVVTDYESLTKSMTNKECFFNFRMTKIKEIESHRTEKASYSIKAHY